MIDTPCFFLRKTCKWPSLTHDEDAGNVRLTGH